MSGIVLSASVRQNLLSLQSTAALLATTQNDLATGNKVNTALDNPTEFFTAQGLNNRANDISNLLDGIGNGVQVLQAANTGITSLQSLIASAQSIANQVLQAPTGYTTKSSVTGTAIPGASANNLLGTGSPATAGTVTAGTFTGPINVSGGSDSLAFTVAVDGGSAQTITISSATIATYNTAHSSATLSASSLSAGNVASLINSQFGSNIASVNGSGNLVFTSTTTGASSSVTLTAQTGTDTSGATGIGVATNTGAAATTVSPLSGETLTIAATNPSSTATNITFGTGANQISTLNQLNTALAANDLQASIDSSGAITITTTNNAASSTVGAIGGGATAAGSPFAGNTAGGAAPVADPNSQATRASLVAQYNIVLQNINTTSQDSSFNGINLLNGDTLNMTFDETGASKLAIAGVTFNDAGLGLSSLGATDFLDSNSANAVLSQLTQASTTLRTEASSLGSNLSIVEVRQDFNKSLINVLQTGASNLTLADPNEEAANSQALSTRQSIAVSALALANQSQQSVLQLLR
jgi:flagellin